MSLIRCFKCQGLGHIATDWLNRKVITLAEWGAAHKEEKDTEPEAELEGDEGESQEGCLAEPDEGEMLVLRQVLSNQSGEKDEQRENIFHF